MLTIPKPLLGFATIWAMASLSDASQLLREAQAHFFAEPPDYAAAETACRAATNVSPGWGEPFHWLGSVFERQGNLQGAADACRRAIDLLAGDPRPLIALGRLQSRRGQHEEAIRLLQEGIALKPHYAEADARLMLAEAFERQRRSYDSTDLPAEKVQTEHRILTFFTLGPFFSEVIVICNLYEYASHMRCGGAVKVRCIAEDKREAVRRAVDRGSFESGLMAIWSQRAKVRQKNAFVISCIDRSLVISRSTQGLLNRYAVRH